MKREFYAFIPPDWTPTAERINALPDPLRRYIYSLETNCDPAGLVRENHVLRSELPDLQRRAKAYDEIGEWLELRGYNEGTLIERLKELERDLRYE